GQAEQAIRELEGPTAGPSSPTPEWQAAPAAPGPVGAPEPQGVVVPLPSATPAAPPPPPAAMPAPAPTTVAAAPAAAEEPPSPSATPAYKRWWFWTLIGAGVVGGILIGIVASSGNTPLCPKGRTCL
ncbi:MAG TPA: hypothetical protein VIU64_12365, partial [Polyangia bacterium]